MLSSDDVFQPAKTTTLLAKCCYCQFVLQTHGSSNQCAVYRIYKSNSEHWDLEKLLSGHKVMTLHSRYVLGMAVIIAKNIIASSFT